MAQVFISYSSDDLPEIQRILRRLDASRIDYWLDKDKIYGGAQWSGQIVRAIEGCVLFLLLASTNSVKSDAVVKEISFAASVKRTILPLWIEKSVAYTDDIAFHLIGVQHIEAHNDSSAWLERLLEAFRKASVTVPDLAERVEQHNSMRLSINAQTSLQPYLADRAEQERRIASELDRHVENTPYRPIAFVLHGDESQMIDGFIKRLELYTFPRLMARLKLPDHLEWKHAQWPICPVADPEADAAGQRAQTYRAEIVEKLELRASADKLAIVQRITTFRRPVLFCSVITSENWQPSEVDLIGKVFEFWAGMPNLPDTQPLVILLAAKSRQPSRSLLMRWFGREPSPVLPAICAAVDHAKSLGLNAIALPELADIHLAEIEDWVRDVLHPADPESAIALIKQKFRQRGLDLRRAQAMCDLAPMLQALLPADAILRGS